MTLKYQSQMLRDWDWPKGQSIVVDPYAFEDPVLCIVPWPWNDFNGTQPFFGDTLESRSDEGDSQSGGPQPSTESTIFFR